MPRVPKETEMSEVQTGTVESEILENPSNEVSGGEPESAEVKRTKKLGKGIEGSIVTITVAGHEPKTYDFNELPEDIRAKFGPFGLGHKLGDSAAGKSGTEAVEAIDKVWEGLMSGDWTTRAPAAPKLTKKSISEAMDNLDDDQKEAAAALLAKLGITL